ncbi:MAG: hypothetical protein HY812_10575 [Planctomycetes bacterium]|nr:hypothetical protein [Planctomycetota bacterium]
MRKPLRLLALLLAGAALAPLARSRQDAAAPVADVEVARQEFERGRCLQAAGILAEVLEAAPGDAGARVLLLRVHVERGAWAEAEAIDQDLGERFPEECPLEVLLARADYAFARGRTAQSEALGLRTVSADAADLRARHVVARALLERGEREAARRFVEESLAGRSLKALDSDGLLAAGRLYLTSGQWEEAAQCCAYAEQKRKREDRPTTDILVQLGDLYRLAHITGGDDVPRAFSTYRDALEQNPALVGAKVGRALVHLYVGDTWDAEKEIDEALALNPASVEALAVKAWFKVLDGQQSDALDLVARALAVNPAATQALATRAAALYLLNRRDECQADVARVLALDPTWGELFLTIGDALSRHMRFAEAVEFHRRAIETDAELPLAHISLGRDLCFLGREQEGREALERSLELHPFPHPWRHNMLLVLKKLDREFVDAGSGAFRFRIHTDENPILAPRLQEALEHDARELAKRYGWSPPGEVLIELLPGHRDFSVRSVGFAGLGALGACFGDLVTLLSPRSELRHAFLWRCTALHELAHVFTLGRSRGRVPRWLTEGLSVYEERLADPTWARDQELELIDACRNEDLIALADFNAAFRGPRVLFAYYQAGQFVQFVAERRGFDRILEMLDSYAADLETPEVVQRVFACAPEELDGEFRAWVLETCVNRYAVQPTFGEKKRGELRRRLRADEQNVDLLADTAWAYYQAGKQVDADVWLERALALAPDHAGALRLAAFRAVDRKRPDLAKEKLEALFQAGGREYRAALLLAHLRREEQDLEGAEEALLIARDCFPRAIGRGSPWLALNEVRAARGDMAGAMEALMEYAALDEKALQPRLDLAAWSLLHEEWEAALRFLREAEQIDPFICEIHVQKGEALRALGRPAEAISSLRAALLVDPRLEPGYTPPAASGAGPDGTEDERRRQAEILVSIAEMEHEAGDAPAALRDLARALELVPGLPSAEELAARLNP